MKYHYLITCLGMDFICVGNGVELDEAVQERLILGMNLDQINISLMENREC